MKVIENFLSKKDFEHLKYILIDSCTFPWYYNPITIGTQKEKKNELFFTHNFLYDKNKVSSFYSIINPVVNKIKSLENVNEFTRIKGNFYLFQNKKIKHEKHTDQDYKHKVALYSLSTTNGFLTVGNKKIKDMQNQCIIFDGSLEHYATTQTDTKERVNINFNYV